MASFFAFGVVRNVFNGPCQPKQALSVLYFILDVSEHEKDIRSNAGGWELLAEKAVCGSCHARNDYSVQHFTGNQWWFVASHYNVSKQQDVPGPIYGKDLGDKRGMVPRNPMSWTKAVVEEPEFNQCMSKRVLSHVFGESIDPKLKNVDAQMRNEAKTGTFRRLMQLALDKYTEDRIQKIDNRSVASGTKILDLHGLVEKHCSSCHGDRATETAADTILKSEGNGWCEKSKNCEVIAVKIANAVMFNRMPKGNPIGPSEKEEFFEAVSKYAWRTDKDKKFAMNYYNMGNDLVHSPGAILSLVDESNNQYVKFGQSSSKSNINLTAILGIIVTELCGGENVKCNLDVLSKAHITR